MEHTPEQDTSAPAPAAQGGGKTKWIIVGVLVIAGLLLAGVLFSPENVAERAIEQASNGDYEVDLDQDGGMNITSDDGTAMDLTVGDSASIPDGWPSSIPVLPDARVESSLVVNDDTEASTNYMLTYVVVRDMASIAEYYKEELAANGWMIEASMVVEESTMLSAGNDTGGEVVININAAEEATTVVISYRSAE